MQPIGLDKDGTPRFKENKIIRYLMMRGHVDLDELTLMTDSGMISKEDYTQLMQLIGYAVYTYGDCSRVSRKVATEAEKIAAALEKGTRRTG